MSNKYQEALDDLSLEVKGLEQNESIKILQELVDKETPMKIVKWDCAKPETRCAKCGAGLERKHDYCWGCGQKLDWGEYE